MKFLCARALRSTFFAMFAIVSALAVAAQQPPAPPDQTPPQPAPAPAPQPAEEHQHDMSGMQHDMAGMQMDMDMPMGNDAQSFLMQHASGTSLNPKSARMDMVDVYDGSKWNVMMHGIAYATRTRQSGRRGGEKTFSTNWLMTMADRPVGSGAIMLRSMLSLEPATITNKRYPLLFQTGETANQLIVDGQHPHDFFMEIAAEYARPIGKNSFFSLYLAPVGDPAVGPVAFPHRTSAMEIPQAALGHHYQDSTHISYNVITAGVATGMLHVEGSVFHGGEPDENRWNIDGGPIDSWGARISLVPTDNLVVQVSRAFLKKPEALEPGNAHRLTSSVAYNVPFNRGYWSSSLVWGQVWKESDHQTLHSSLVETTLQFANRNTIVARYEHSDKDELFPHVHPPGSPTGPPVPVFKINAYTLGYTFDAYVGNKIRAGIGGNFTYNTLPAIMKLFYGEHPEGYNVYLRFRSTGGHHMNMM